MPFQTIFLYIVFIFIAKWFREHLKIQIISQETSPFGGLPFRALIFRGRATDMSKGRVFGFYGPVNVVIIFKIEIGST